MNITGQSYISHLIVPLPPKLPDFDVHAHRRLLSRHRGLVLWSCFVCGSDFVCEHREAELVDYFAALPLTRQVDMIDSLDLHRTVA